MSDWTSAACYRASNSGWNRFPASSPAAAAALWLGFESVLPYVVMVTILGGLLAAALSSWSGGGGG